MTNDLELQAKSMRTMEDVKDFCVAIATQIEHDFDDIDDRVDNIETELKEIQKQLQELIETLRSV